jgi:hypothetical protein
VLPSNLTGASCDLNSSTDTSVPTSTSSSGNSSIGSGAVSQATIGEGTRLPDPTANPVDPLRDASVITGSPFTYSEASNGTPTISGLTLCANGNTNPTATVTVSNNPTSTGGDPLLPLYGVSVTTTLQQTGDAMAILLAAYAKGPAGHYGTIDISYTCDSKNTIKATGSITTTPKTIDRIQGYPTTWQDRGTYIYYARQSFATAYFRNNPADASYYLNVKAYWQSTVSSGYTSGFELTAIIYTDGSSRSVTSDGLNWPY